MARFLSAIPLRELLVEQLPLLAVAIVIAEFFYKFHSFTLECIAFLLTWYALDWMMGKFVRTNETSHTRHDGM
jgi:hypothetical protein